MKKFSFFIKTTILVLILAGSAYGRTLPFGDVPTGDEWKDNARDQKMNQSMYSGTRDPLIYNNAQDKHQIRWSSKETGGVTYGDFLITGASVLEDDGNKGSFQYADYSKYVNDKGWRLNSATAELKGTSFVNSRGEQVEVEAGDIIFARLYWQGMFFDRRSPNEAGPRHHIYKEFYDAIKDYRTVSIMGNDNKKHEVIASMDDTYVAYSYSNATASTYGYGYRMWYSASADVTNIVKSSFGDSKTKSFTVGDVKTTRDYIKNNGIHNNDYFGLYRFQDNSWPYLKYASYGGWSLVVVYDDTKTREAEKRFDPKSITIYDGFTFLWSGSRDGESADMTLGFDGFYTPRDSKFDAKMGYFMTAITGAADRAAGLKIKKNNATIRRESDWDDINKAFDIDDSGLNKAGYQYNFSITYLDENKKQQHVNESKKTNRFIDIDTYDLTGKLESRQTSTEINLKVTSKIPPRGVNIQTGRSLISMVAFSTDIYMPDVCYYSTVYNRAGQSSRSAGGFVVTPNEILKNQVYFTLSKDSDSETSEGLVVMPKLSKNLSYQPNTTKISNPGDHDPTSFSNMEAILDNQPNSKGKRYNNFINAQRLEFYVGEGAGVMQNSVISGGLLTKNTKAFVEYDSKIGGYYEEPIYEYSFSLNGVPIDYRATMKQCPPPEGENDTNIVKLVPLDGLRVVNEDFEKKGDNGSLYTQVVNKPFQVKIAYDNNLTGVSEGNLTNILGDDDMGKILCKKNNLSDDECKEQKDDLLKEFNEKRADYEKERQEAITEIPILEKELIEKQDALKEAQKTYDDSQKAYDNAKKAYDSAKATDEDEDKLEKLKKDMDDAKKKLDDDKKKLDDAKDDVQEATDDLNEMKKQLADSEADLAKIQTPFENEFFDRFSNLRGMFVITLTTQSDLDKIWKEKFGERKDIKKTEVCDYLVKENDAKKHHYKFFQDFTSETRKDKIGDKEIITITNKEKSKNNAYTSFDFFSKEGDNAGIIDVKDVDIGLARRDYTFAVSYLPSGVESLTRCQVDCIEKNTVDGVRDNQAISKCQAECQKDIDADSVDEGTYSINICNTDEFSIRPAYFKFEKPINDIYIAGGKEVDEDLKESIYPADSSDNYVLGYDAQLVPVHPSASYGDAVPTIFSQLSTDDCLSENIENIYYDSKTKQVFYDSNVSNVDKILWSKEEKSSNNLFVDFSVKNSNLGVIDEITEYNKINTKSDLSTLSKAKKAYAIASLKDLGGVNYYNIGYAKMRLTDSLWTGDDIADSVSGCVDGNYSYINNDKSNNKGMVGCYIGIEEQDLDSISGIGESIKSKLIPQDLVFKFKHSDIEVNINDLQNKLDNNGHKYTYFSNSEDMTSELSMASSAFFNAYIDENSQNQKILATLYNKNCYARDIVFGLDFEFNCDGSNLDDDKIDNIDKLNGANRCRLADTSGNNSISDQYEQFCAINPLHSRCYVLPKNDMLYDGNNSITDGILFFANGGVQNYNINTTIPSSQIEYPFNASASSVLKPLYVYNKLKSDDPNDNNISSSRLPVFIFNKDSFINGVNIGNIGINFVRDVNQPINPKIIYAEDFIKNKDVKFSEHSLLTDKSIKNNELITKDIISDVQSFNNYQRGEKISETTDKAIGNYYYGYLNSQDSVYGSANLPLPLNENNDVRIFSLIYARDYGNNQITNMQNLSLLYGDNGNNAYTGVLPNDKDRQYFYQNPAEFNTRNAKADWFMSRPNNGSISGISGVSSARSSMIREDNSQFENLQISSDQAGIYTIEVHTPEWLVHDQQAQDANVNSFVMIFGDLTTGATGAQWGGVGETISGDTVGRYLDENSSQRGLVNTPNQGNRINW